MKMSALKPYFISRYGIILTFVYHAVNTITANLKPVRKNKSQHNQQFNSTEVLNNRQARYPDCRKIKMDKKQLFIYIRRHNKATFTLISKKRRISKQTLVFNLIIALEEFTIQQSLRITFLFQCTQDY